MYHPLARLGLGMPIIPLGRSAICGECKEGQGSEGAKVWTETSFECPERRHKVWPAHWSLEDRQD